MFSVFWRIVLIRTYPVYFLGCRSFHKKTWWKHYKKKHSNVYECKLVWKLVKCKQITQLSVIITIIVGCPQSYDSPNLIGFSHSHPPSPTPTKKKKQAYVWISNIKCTFYDPEVDFENVLNILSTVKSKWRRKMKISNVGQCSIVRE